MTRVVAQGTFDLLHPGHVHYLEDAATYGDELHAIVARSANVTHKPEPILCARQRRDMVAALGAVDEAHLGDPEDVFVPIERLDPDVIVLGYDQHHDEAGIAESLDGDEHVLRVAEVGLVDRLEGGDHVAPLARAEDRLRLVGDVVAAGDDGVELVAVRRRVLQVVDVAGMEQVERPLRDDPGHRNHERKPPSSRRSVSSSLSMSSCVKSKKCSSGTSTSSTSRVVWFPSLSNAFQSPHP